MFLYYQNKTKTSHVHLLHVELKQNVGTLEREISSALVANMIFHGATHTKNALNVPVIAIAMKLTGKHSSIWEN